MGMIKYLITDDVAKAALTDLLSHQAAHRVTDDVSHDLASALEGAVEAMKQLIAANAENDDARSKFN